jgi:YggT family protein
MLNFIRMLLDFVVSISFDLIIFLVIFQFLLELVDTNFHHPIKQYILHYTAPLAQPLHRYLPSYKNIDIGLLFLLFILQNLKLILLFLLVWQFPNLALLFIWSSLLIINSFINFYLFFVLFRVLINWVLPIYSNHPATQLLYILTEPLLRPIRTLLHTKKGFDWTPLVVIIGLKLLSILITYILFLAGAPDFIR